MYLIHHGIKGQKWGVRRYQNPDGSYTEEGRKRNMYRNRARNAYKTKKDMDTLYNKMSDKDKYLLMDDDYRKEWLTLEEGSAVVKRFIKKVGNEPVAAIDIMDTGDNENLAVAIMTDPNHRGHGYGYEIAKKGMDWYDKNKDRIGAKSLSWDPYTNNKPSRALAEKLGFEYDEKESNDIYAKYYKK